MLTQEELKLRLKYNKNTGLFKWISKPTKSQVNIGDVAGSYDSYGYIQIQLNNKTYKAHRLVWLYVHGYFPKCIDHIDSIRSNNKLLNLREVSYKQNASHRVKPIINTTGYKGVKLIVDKRQKTQPKKKWLARIGVKGKLITLGSFYTKEEAAIAYDIAAIKYHKEFAILNFPKPIVSNTKKDE